MSNLIYDCPTCGINFKAEYGLDRCPKCNGHICVLGRADDPACRVDYSRYQGDYFIPAINSTPLHPERDNIEIIRSQQETIRKLTDAITELRKCNKPMTIIQIDSKPLKQSDIDSIRKSIKAKQHEERE